jgi:hypothetical protein
MEPDDKLELWFGLYTVMAKTFLPLDISSGLVALLVL